MEDRDNKNKNSNVWLCRHNNSKTWQPACKNCLKDIKAWQKTINSLCKKQCYLVTFGDVGETSKQSEKALTLLEKIPKEIKKKMTGRVENEVFFILPLLRETKINEKGKEELVVKVGDGKLIVNFYNQSIKVPISWKTEDNAYAGEKNRYIGIACKMKKVYPQLDKNQRRSP